MYLAVLFELSNQNFFNILKVFSLETYTRIELKSFFMVRSSKLNFLQDF